MGNSYENFTHDFSIKKELDNHWREAQPLMQQWWFEADVDIKMTTGQQDYWNALYNSAGYRNQKMLMFNKVLRVVNMIEGYQRKNRLATIASPTENASQETADLFSDCIHWAMQVDNTYEKISECFSGSTICGLNLINAWMDYREDPENGNICTSRIPFNAFLMDPYWTKADLSDCDWIWTRRYMTKNQVVSLYPKIKDDLHAMQSGYGAKDGRFQFLAQNWYQYQQEIYAYDEYWKRTYRPTRKLLDTKTGECIEWKGTRDQFRFLKRFNPNVTLIKGMKPTITFHALVNNHLVYQEEQPYGIDKYPFIPFIGYHYPEVQNYAYRYQGVVRNIRDSQVELNRRRNRMLDILDSQVQSGLMVKEDAMVNPEDAFLQGPGRVQFFKQTANLDSDVKQIQPPQIPPSMFELEKMLDAEIMQIAGVNEELFGESASGQDMSGFLSSLRMGAALVSLQGLFDKLNQSQKLLGELFIDLIQANFEPAKIQKITGKPATPEFTDKEFQKYHCVIEEGQLTASQKQLQFQQAFQLKQMGMAIPDSYLLDKSTLQGKKDLIAAMEQQNQATSQMQQMQQQVSIKAMEAKIENDFAAAEERKTRAVSNIGLAKERSSQAVHDRAAAALDNAKALVEIEGMNEQRLLKLAEFILKMQQAQKDTQGREEGDSVEEAEAVEQPIEQVKQQTT